MTITDEVTSFCQSNSKMAWILLGVLALLFIIYISMPCVFDFFSWDNLCCLFQSIWKGLVKFWDSLSGAACGSSSDDCGCGKRHFLGESCDDDGLGGGGASGSSSGGVRYVSGEGNIVVNLPAINVTVNGMEGGSLSPIVVPPAINVPPIYPQVTYGPSGGGGCSTNGGIEDCEVIDSVNMCGKKYAITYLSGIIRVYDASGCNILQTITHNLGVLRSIRYENDQFVVEDSQSLEYSGVIVNGNITFTPYP
jgi:hypothetical protein